MKANVEFIKFMDTYSVELRSVKGRDDVVRYSLVRPHEGNIIEILGNFDTRDEAITALASHGVEKVQVASSPLGA